MTTSMLKKKDWSTQTRRALTATEVVANLAKVEGWKLTGDGADVAIEKTYHFANYYETISFVNALAFVANAQDHHPRPVGALQPLRGAPEHPRRARHLFHRLRVRDPVRCARGLTAAAAA
jgi:pterin-4a-carbinolamine dehydratase